MAKKGKPQEVVSEDESDVQNDAAIGRALVGSLIVFAGIGLLVGAGYWYYLATRPKPIETKTEVAMPTERKFEQVTLPNIPLTDITKNAGIEFVHHSGKEGSRLLPETMGGGGGFIDFDRDGDQDIVLVNSCDWPWSAKLTQPAPTTKLYRNDGQGNFLDATVEAGLDLTFYGMGVAAGDFDGDGWTDLFFTAVGKSRLMRNDRGKFIDVTDAMGVGGDPGDWTCPAMFFDYDRDGKLDLMVGRYVVWSKEIDLKLNFTLTGLGRAYGQPTSFGGTYLSLYHNEGDRFVDVAPAAGVIKKNPATGVPEGKSLGMALMDFDRDGWLDVIVANDTVAKFLFHNQKNGTFKEIGVAANVAFDRRGVATGAMGVDCAYYRNDENMAIAIGNFANEPSSLYVSKGNKPQFFDSAVASGLGPQTLLKLTFGVFFADLDLDGRQDLVCANGHLEEEISKVQPSEQYEQPPQLFWNAGKKSSTELIELGAGQVGESFLTPIVGRGAAYADIDSDGDLDVLLIANGSSAKLFRNDQKLGNHWLRFRLSGQSITDAIGAEVEVKVDGVTMRRMVTPTRSYLSLCELPVTFGLGTKTSIESAMVRWPDGTEQTIQVDGVDRTLEVVQGQPQLKVIGD